MFQTFTLHYMTMPVNLQLWFWIKMSQLKEEEAESFWKTECQKLQRLYTQGGAAYGYVQNLLKTSSLPVPKMIQFLLPKTYVKKVTLVTRTFRRMKSFACFRNEIWCMDTSFSDKLGKDEKRCYVLISSLKLVCLNRRFKRNKNKGFEKKLLDQF